MELLSFKNISPCNASLLYIAYIDGKLPCQLYRRLLLLRTPPPQQEQISPSFPQTIYWTSFLRKYWFFHDLFCKLIQTMQQESPTLYLFPSSYHIDFCNYIPPKVTCVCWIIWLTVNTGFRSVVCIMSISGVGSVIRTLIVCATFT